LINKILQEFFEFSRFAKRIGAIALMPKSFSGIINACPKETLTENAKKAGSVGAVDLFRVAGRRQNYDEVVHYLTRILAEYANWFKCEHYIINNKEYFHLRHDLGEKWSIYLAEVTSTFIEYFTSKKVKKEFLEGAVTLELSSSPCLNSGDQRH
jgi:hypothetical protein